MSIQILEDGDIILSEVFEIMLDSDWVRESFRRHQFENLHQLTDIPAWENQRNYKIGGDFREAQNCSCPAEYAKVSFWQLLVKSKSSC